MPPLIRCHLYGSADARRGRLSAQAGELCGVAGGHQGSLGQPGTGERGTRLKRRRESALSRMCHDQQRFGASQDTLERLAQIFGIESSEALVQQKQLGLLQQGACQEDPAALAL